MFLFLINQTANSMTWISILVPFYSINILKNLSSISVLIKQKHKKKIKLLVYLNKSCLRHNCVKIFSS